MKTKYVAPKIIFKGKLKHFVGSPVPADKHIENDHGISS